ncbi:TPM domain-containing protein [Streptococcus suis]|nr:TPM domain-containing protein [Streptococcus suis]
MKKYLCYLLGFLLLLFSLGQPSSAMAEGLPNRPIDSTVQDERGYLSTQAIATIDAENQAWQTTEEQLQIGVYVTDYLTSDIESLANELFRKWQVGYAGTDNGVLLVVAIEERQFRLETSDNAATILTDVEAKRILEESRSFFREGDYDNGILFIVDAIGDQFYGTDRAQARLDHFEEEYGIYKGEESIFPYLTVLVVIIILLVIDKRGRGGGGPGSFLWIPIDGYRGSRHHRSHSSGSSSFGGGGWSGGGGGGGGASSGW